MMRDQNRQAWHADFLAVWMSVIDSQALSKGWKQSTLYDELQRLVTDLDVTEIVQGNSPRSDKFENLYNLVATRAHGEHRPASVHGGPHTILPIAALRPPLPSNASKSIDFHFRWTQSWLPIMDKGNVHRSLYRVRRDEAVECAADEASLYALLSLTTVQQSGDNLEHQLNTSSASLFATHAHRLLHECTGPPTPTTVQTMLLLALHHITRDCQEDAWVLVGRATRAIALLQRSCGDELLPLSFRPERELLKRLNLAAFVLDSLLSAHLRLPHALGPSGSGPIERLIADGTEEWEPGPTSSTSIFTNGPGFCLSTFNDLVDFSVQLSIMQNSAGGDQKDMMRPRVRLDQVASTFPQHQTLHLFGTVLALMESPTVADDGDLDKLLLSVQTVVTTYNVYYPISTVPIIWPMLIDLVKEKIEALPRTSNVQDTAMALARFLKAAEVNLHVAASVRPAFDNIGAREPTDPCDPGSLHILNTTMADHPSNQSGLTRFTAATYNVDPMTPLSGGGRTDVFEAPVPDTLSTLPATDRPTDFDVNVDFSGYLMDGDAYGWDHHWDQSLHNLGFADVDMPLLDLDFPLSTEQEFSLDGADTAS
ncbi:hypothetical protein LTR78_003426 [Recurvomyces mirabilis]|uniref:Xylanolytic transcriptional activator regulatory domain-containing protein n=1 Tax=Recurvomyces mirabilis TaxID=574656 RepID=A0AAE1C3C9_9PEZI|nr:hypothetical protein LTR78_003426 [Recurvomyces mirabilis]KAK5154540.1 hypothetical protein LTS14_006677 [Recurvomyces mirabilis]